MEITCSILVHSTTTGSPKSLYDRLLFRTENRPATVGGIVIVVIDQHGGMVEKLPGGYMGKILCVDLTSRILARLCPWDLEIKEGSRSGIVGHFNAGSECSTLSLTWGSREMTFCTLRKKSTHGYSDEISFGRIQGVELTGLKVED